MADEFDCYPCRTNSEVGALPPREHIYLDASWRVAHAFDTALPGWLVVLPRRHITSLAELTDTEAAALGPLLRRLSAALGETTGCVKTCVMLFAEAIEHVHIHVVPRMPGLKPERRGPSVVAYLGASEDAQVTEAERDALAERLRDCLR